MLSQINEFAKNNPYSKNSILFLFNLQICQCVSENNPKNRTSHEINVGKLYTVYTIIVMVFVTVEKQCNVKFTQN